jgi:hypothetical protein
MEDTRVGHPQLPKSYTFDGKVRHPSDYNQFDTLNRAYLNAQTLLGRQPYLSNVPWQAPESSGFYMELRHLEDIGVGPDQWLYATGYPLP